MVFSGKGGRQYSLSAERFAGGGEGDIYSVLNDIKLVAKIYKPGKARPEKENKIIRMVDFPPDKSVLNQIAWPQDVIYDENRRFAGFIMPKLETNEDLNIIYEPGASSKYPEMPWRSKIIIAENLCAVLHGLHEASHVCGDLNPKNISVNPGSGLIVFLDTDSYHIQDGMKTYRCDVAIPEYLASEIQAKMRGDCTLATAPLPTFTKETDYFALAVHIFQLLMNGAHPFACAVIPGRQDSVAAPQPSDNIVKGLFPFMQNIPGMKIPVYAPSINILPEDMKQLFKRAFIDGHRNPGARPSPVEWHAALRRLRNSLVQCHDVPNHQYYNKLDACPWCKAENAFTQTLLAQTPISPNPGITVKPPPVRPPVVPSAAGITGAAGLPAGSYTNPGAAVPPTGAVLLPGSPGSHGSPVIPRTYGATGATGVYKPASPSGLSGVPGTSGKPVSPLPEEKKGRAAIWIIIALIIIAIAITAIVLLTNRGLNPDTPEPGDEWPTDTSSISTSDPSDTIPDSTGSPDDTGAVTPSQTTFNVSVGVNNESFGSVNSSHAQASQNATVRLTAVAAGGYIFDHWEVVSGAMTLSSLVSSSTTFKMPGSDVSITACFRLERTVVYPVIVNPNDPTFGTANADYDDAEPSAIVHITASPNQGYRFERWEVLSGSVSIANNTNANTSFIMPESDVTVVAHFVPLSYNTWVDYLNPSEGTATANPSSAIPGTLVTLTATPHAGYEFDRWEIIEGGVTLNNRNSPLVTFSMPNNDVYITAYFKTAQSRYSITVAYSAGGIAEASIPSAEQGTTVYILASPDDGYAFDYFEFVSGGDTSATFYEPWFIMPNNAVTIRVHFRAIDG